MASGRRSRSLLKRHPWTLTLSAFIALLTPLPLACSDTEPDNSGDACTGECSPPGAVCRIDPPPGSKAPSIECLCTTTRTWCCNDDCDPGTGGTAGVGGSAGAGGSAGSSGAGGSAGSGGAAGSAGSGGVSLDDLGTPCAQGQCPDGLTAVTYCGIAGCDVGAFCSCEIPCGENAQLCPSGTTCATISDGPGDVCVKS
jgi:hypothetical protein